MLDISQASPVFASSPKQPEIKRLSSLVFNHYVQTFSLVLAQQGAAIVPIQNLAQIKARSLDHALQLDSEHRMNQSALEHMLEIRPEEIYALITFWSNGYWIEARSAN